ncbi:acyl-CoA dehydrogenase family protein [Streptomyces sp. NBC_01016]|uniref:acyl-CoA dehydrogenase family protein n=1 Tax=Streptomyces sp. NBC_01016 TaxID=2903720 RepID=UPI00225658A2|nr:acyl-CoA dehydrogenase family protein [Streptomyces sp. NBC_01016]MCX4831258.1 acyl-CoA dehydrogenase family protein [Streptomyces sp. NBC_01016]
MQAEEFRLVREALGAFVADHRCTSAEPTAAQRSAAQKALDALGLIELRRGARPLATAQECALLAEDFGRQPMAASFLGTVLLAPEVLRLLDADGGDVSYEGTPTIALGRDLRFGGGAGDGRAWDAEGADSALHVADDGTVRTLALGDMAPTTDLLRAVRVAKGEARAVGRLSREHLRAWQAWALVMVSSELVGAADSFVEQAAAYARDRVQYGRPIGSYQAVQHLLADATVAVEACASATRYAAWCLDHAGADAALTAARVAKAEVDVSALQAVSAGMQVFGGIAQTWEHIAHLYLRRVRVGATVLTGTAELLSALAGPRSSDPTQWQPSGAAEATDPTEAA